MSSKIFSTLFAISISTPSNAPFYSRLLKRQVTDYVRVRLLPG
jgi:hypothetical protein